MFLLEWVFRNDHKWHKTFATESEAHDYIQLCKMNNDYNIVSFKVTEIFEA